MWLFPSRAVARTVVVVTMAWGHLRDLCLSRWRCQGVPSWAVREAGVWRRGPLGLIRGSDGDAGYPRPLTAISLQNLAFRPDFD